MLAERSGMQRSLQRCQGWLEMLRMMYRYACSPSALPWQTPSFQGALSRWHAELHAAHLFQYYPSMQLE